MTARAVHASQRRKVLAELRTIKELIKWLEAGWNVRSTVYVEPTDRAPGDNVWLRDRLPEEYPEEKAASWAHVYNASDEMIKRLELLRELAYVRYHQTLPTTEVSR